MEKKFENFNGKLKGKNKNAKDHKKSKKKTKQSKFLLDKGKIKC